MKTPLSASDVLRQHPLLNVGRRAADHLPRSWCDIALRAGDRLIDRRDLLIDLRNLLSIRARFAPVPATFRVGYERRCERSREPVASRKRT
jgi:hypothetical protein